MIVKRLHTVLVLIILALTTSDGWAQSRHLTASNVAMAGGGTAYLNDYHANFINPANLMLHDADDPVWTVGFMGGISSSVGGSLANISAYNKYFTTGKTLDQATTETALNELFGSDKNASRTLGANIDMVLGGVSYRTNKWSASMSVRFRGLYSSTMSRGFGAFFLQGPSEAFFSNARPVNASMELTTFTEISFGGAMELWRSTGGSARLYAGIAPKLLIGMQGSRYKLDSQMKVNGGQIEHNFSYSAETVGSMTHDFQNYMQARMKQGYENVDPGNYFDSPDGNDLSGSNGAGFGVDLGLTFEQQMSDQSRLRVAVSLTDLGSIQYKSNTGRFYNTRDFKWNGFEYDKSRIDKQYDSMGDYMEHVVADSVGKGIYLDYSSDESPKLTRTLPAMFNLGSQYTHGKFSASLDFGVGMVEQGLNTPRSSLALGAEYKIINKFPVRAGIRFGGISSTALSFGTGLELRRFEFSLGMMSVPNSSGHGSINSAAWSGLVFHF